MKEYKQEFFSGERALFSARDLKIYDSVFADGESPLKESKDIEIFGSIFKWKYPIWYSENVFVKDSTLLEGARSGIWYTSNILMQNCVIEAPKTFRRSEKIKLVSCDIPKAQETLWYCKDVELDTVCAVGDYFGLSAENVSADKLTIDGNYAFDGGKNIEIKNSRLISKDAFWNAENVTVYDSLIIGEYLGWNSKNVTFVNCTIESNQGMCYMENVKLVNCKLICTDLAFEYSTVDAEITSEIESVKNPTSGKIKAKKIKEIIMDEKFVDTSLTTITTEE